MSAFELRPYQVKCLQAIAEAERRGVTRQLVVMSTGCGKTVVIAELLRQRGLPRTFGFMHREELLSQAKDKILALNPGAKVGIEKAESYADLAIDQVVLASVQTIGKKNRARLSGFPSDWPQIIWNDEAHHMPASGNLEVLDHFGVYGENPCRDVLLIGTTATPDRLDEMGYDRIFDDVSFRYDLREAIKDKWLADIHAFRIKSDLDMSHVRKRAGDFVEKDLAEAIKQSRMNEVAGEKWAERCRGRKSLFFCVTKDHARDVEAVLKRHGAKVALITDDTKAQERRAIVDLFRTGDLEAMVNVSIFTEGADFPDIECVHVLKPTASRALYSQMIGRGSRRTATKSFFELFDYTDQVHDVCSVGQIFGLPDSWELKGQSVLEDAEKVEEIEEELGLKIDGAKNTADLVGRLKEKRVEMVVNTITDSGLPGKLAWLRPSQVSERWVIGWRNETREKLGKLPDRVRASAEKIIESKNLWGIHERIEIFRNELGLYEARIEKTGVQSARLDSDKSLAKLVQRVEKQVKEKRPHKLKLLEKNAKWRSHPASDAQKGILEKKGVPSWLMVKLSKGDAANLINIPNATVKQWFEGVKEEDWKQ